ncbi:biopolymer transport protein TolR [Sphingomonas vulcanisoli]|uniref:Biopolymer transport protein TolR n=1 Tax=Sphingomonas vulcanisoli TaxID=1658060 RepID=A0ABX0TSH6_9SPHN|nr:protein TolR [Sphingomonas vulcanisoli]NIJ06566.1 biopolymer transport protein TolR [Sphingomonas vulcanisoli]
MAMGPVARRNHGRRRTPMAEINVTPLVDVMLVLLIIFMVTAPLLVAGVPVNLPQSRAGALDQDKKPIQVSLDKDGKVFLDEEQIALAALPDRLAARKTAAGADLPQVFLRADRGLDYGRVMTVMGELSRAGLTKVALVTETGEKK